jgi:hypothetical protein
MLDADTRPHIESEPRPMRAGHALFVVVVALVIGLVLNAADIEKTALRQEAGPMRTVSLAVMGPVAKFSSVLFLDRPRRAIDAALGRSKTSQETSTETAEPSTTTTTIGEVTTPTSPLTRQVSTADPLRVFVGGDSMVGQFGPMLENRAEATGLATAEVDYEFDSGLTRPDFIDWPARLRDVRKTQNPDVIVLFFGGNDGQDIKVSGTWVPFGEPAWIAEYTKRVGDLMTELNHDGRDVYWVGMPIVSSKTFQAKIEIMNEIYRTEAAKHRMVHFIDSKPVFSGADGGFSEYLPDDSGDLVDMRLNDGVHLTTAGGQRLAKVVWAAIAAEWRLPDS